MAEVNDTFVAGRYDVIVIGAGHAGCEAACAAARLGRHPVGHNESGFHRPASMQSFHRRTRQRDFGAGDRRLRRRNGQGNRSKPDSNQNVEYRQRPGSTGFTGPSG